MKRVKKIVEYYCFVAEKNVAFELTAGDKTGSANCLNEHFCRNLYGECRNTELKGILK